MNVRENANAKINIALDVTGVRHDGYHEVKMIMQDLSLHDEIEISASPDHEKTGGKVFLTMEGASPDVPLDERNIAVKAALLMMETYGIDESVSINLIKHIPSAAGLAGGSADAAAVIRGMNRLFDLGLSLDKMMELGVKLGADVPYCIMGGTALAEGIGEKLTPLLTPKFFRGLLVLLVKPYEGVSTKEVYTALDEVCGWKKGMEEVKEPGLHPKVDATVMAMQNEDINGLCESMGNILEKVTIKKLPEIEKIKNELLSAGARVSMMSGSGPTVFALFDTSEGADEAYKLIDRKYPGKYTLIMTEIMGRNE